MEEEGGGGVARLEPGKEFTVSQVRAEAAWNPGGIGSEDKSHGQTRNCLGRRCRSAVSGLTAVGVRERGEPQAVLVFPERWSSSCQRSRGGSKGVRIQSVETRGLKDMLTIRCRRRFHYLDLQFRREDQNGHTTWGNFTLKMLPGVCKNPHGWGEKPDLRL